MTRKIANLKFWGRPMRYISNEESDGGYFWVHMPTISTVVYVREAREGESAHSEIRMHGKTINKIEASGVMSARRTAEDWLSTFVESMLLLRGYR
jgi:hypothetical protein